MQANASAPEIEINDSSEGTVRYVEHGSPSDLIRWHVHENFELHLTVATRGKVFIGDYIGPFAPGQLILTGSRVPHNWITTDPKPVPLRDKVLQFKPATMEQLQALLPETAQLRSMLERARYGLEFLGIPLEESERRFDAIRDARRMDRLIKFMALMRDLAEWSDYQLLSTVQIDSEANETAQRKISTVIDHVMTNYSRSIRLSDAAGLVGMTETYFSRFFRHATGHRFVDLVNQVRISRACSLLVETDRQITNICYEVGFNNVANFNRRFQKLKKVTPTEYREQAILRNYADLPNINNRSLLCASRL